MSADALFERWRTMADSIASDVLDLMETRQRWRAVNRMFRANPRLNPSQLELTDIPAYDWVWHLWGTHALMGIRRELDDQHGVHNLWHLLHEIRDRPEALNRNRFWDHLQVHSLDFEARATADRYFERLGIVAHRSGHGWWDHIDPQRVRRDLKALVVASRPAFRCAQLMVAHRVPKDDVGTDRGEIDRAINAIWSTTKRYHFLLKGEALRAIHYEPEPEWLKTFDVAWRLKPKRRSSKGTSK